MSEKMMPKRMLRGSELRVQQSINYENAYLAQDLRIPENDDTVFRTSQSNVQTTGVVQETDALMFITPNAAENDVVLLSALERVDAGNFNFLV